MGMTVDERVRIIYKEYFGTSFHKNRKEDIENLNTLAFVLGNNGINITGKYYFHFKLNEKGAINSDKFNDNIINNLFIGEDNYFYESERRHIQHIKSCVPPHLIKNLAKLEYIKYRKGYISERTMKEIFVKQFGSAKEFKEAYECFEKLNYKELTQKGKLISKSTHQKEAGLSR